MASTSPQITTAPVQTAKKRRSMEGLGPTQRISERDEDIDYISTGTSAGNGSVRSSKRRIMQPRAASLGIGKNSASDNNDGNNTDTASLGSVNSSSGGRDEDALKNNNDYCENCLGLGEFICCDTCPKAFHFSCCHPPLDPDNLPDEWHCNECRARLYPPDPAPNGVFKQLLDNLNCMNPRSFALPVDMRTYFKNVEASSDGDYVDSMEFKPEPTTAAAQAAAALAAAEEPFQLQDSKTGEIRLCFRCGKSALNKKMMVSCDHCPNHWHLDCLDPPLASPPPSSRRWMCPIHVAAHVLPRTRKRRDAVPIRVSDPYAPNDGDIEIIEEPDSPPPEPDQKRIKSTQSTVKAIEMMDNSGVVYRIPEKSIKLNFLEKVLRIRESTPQSAEEETEEEAEEEQGESTGSNANMLDILAAAAIACDGEPASVAQQDVQDSILSQLTSPQDREEYLHFRAFQRVLKEKGLEDQVRRWVAEHDQFHNMSHGQSSASRPLSKQQHQHHSQSPSPPHFQHQHSQNHQHHHQQQQQQQTAHSVPQEQEAPRITIKKEKLEELARQELLLGQQGLSRRLSSGNNNSPGLARLDQEQPSAPVQQPRETAKDDTSKAKAI
ncbi:hypothetical protein BGZ83_006531 [Gryganskiella cystojenkinii]|nr:hypothetical protein BGZ83_006531 [Gryganskiella cystojenkinii]